MGQVEDVEEYCRIHLEAYRLARSNADAFARVAAGLLDNLALAYKLLGLSTREIAELTGGSKSGVQRVQAAIATRGNPREHGAGQAGDDQLSAVWDSVTVNFPDAERLEELNVNMEQWLKTRGS